MKKKSKKGISGVLPCRKTEQLSVRVDARTTQTLAGMKISVSEAIRMSLFFLNEMEKLLSEMPKTPFEKVVTHLIARWNAYNNNKPLFQSLER